MERADVKQRIAKFLENVENLGDFIDQARIGKALVELFDKVELLTIFHDKADDSYLLSSAEIDGQKRKEWSRHELLEGLEAAFSKEKAKRCADKTCRKLKPLSHFAKCKYSLDGRARRCKRCEADRISRFKKRQRVRQKLMGARADN